LLWVLQIYTVDSFTDVPFSGNPAAVALVPAGVTLDETTMKKLATEMNLSETAYVMELQGHGTFEEGTRFGLRWFTPTLEVNLCGHATLATAKVIFDAVGNPSDTLSFETLSGVLVATRTSDGISMELPKNASVEEAAEKHQALITLAVGDLPVERCFYSITTKKLGIHLGAAVTRAQLEALRPDTKAMQDSTSNAIVTGVMVTMAGAPQPGDYDMISRYFAPWNGIPEDPATGSAHTARCSLFAFVMFFATWDAVRSHRPAQM
jgi:PhzF family phenazine biosynthesis protein